MKITSYKISSNGGMSLYDSIKTKGDSSFNADVDSKNLSNITISIIYKDGIYHVHIYDTNNTKTSIYREDFSNKREIYDEISSLLKKLHFKSIDSESRTNSIDNSYNSINEFSNTDNPFEGIDNDTNNDNDDNNDEDDGISKEETSLLDELSSTSYYSQVEMASKSDFNFDDYKTLTPRDYQEETIKDIIDTLKDKRRGMAVLPTGYGKTFISASVAKELQEYELSKGKKTFRILFLVHKNDIVYQTANLFNQETKTKGPYTNYFGIDKVGVLQGSKIKGQEAYTNQISGELNDVVVANIKTMIGKIEHGEIPNDYFDMIIADECHRSVGRIYKECIDYFMNGGAKYLLGLTATPSRISRRTGQTTDDLFTYFCHTSKNDVIVNKSLLDSINGEHLATPLYYIRFDELLIDTLIENTRGSILARENNIIVKNINTSRLNLSICKEDAKHLYDSGKKCVVFCESIKFAEQMYNDLIEITGNKEHVIKMFFKRFKDHEGVYNLQDNRKITPQVMMEKIETFKSLDRGFIVVVDLFTEGTDIPNIDALMLLRPTTSERIYFQILGRGLRKTETKEVCEVYDYNFDTISLDLLTEKLNLLKGINNSIIQKHGRYNTTREQTERYIEGLIDKLQSILKDRHSKENMAILNSMLIENAKKFYTSDVIDQIYNVLQGYKTISSRSLTIYTTQDIIEKLSDIKIKNSRKMIISGNYNNDSITEIPVLLSIIQNKEATVEEIKKRLRMRVLQYKKNNQGQITSLTPIIEKVQSNIKESSNYITTKTGIKIKRKVN